MSTVATHRLEFLSFSCRGVKSSRRFHRAFATLRMSMDSKSSEKRKVDEISVQAPSLLLPVTKRELFPQTPDFQFERLQPSDYGILKEKIFEFGSFVAREAVIDEEYWSAAWIRAESQWEDRLHDRYADSHKRQFAEQEFYEIKKRSKYQSAQKSTCIVTAKKEAENVKRSVLKSIVGTLDLSIRYLLPGETFPGERVNAPPFGSVDRTSQSRYCYIANLCVVKSARRQGIASNMLHFALQSAISDGIKRIYVHVHRYNEAAQELYRKMGFQIVDLASPLLLEEQMFLLCVKI